MKISEYAINLIAEETNVSKRHVQKYYDILNEIPCVCNGGRIQLLNCLYILINLKKNNKENESFDYLLSDALYKIYKEDSLPFLSSYYKSKLNNNYTKILTK